MAEKTGHYAVADWRLRFVRSQSRERERSSAKILKESAPNKACNESYEEQLPDFDSWALTAGILLNKVLFFSNKRTRL